MDYLLAPEAERIVWCFCDVGTQHCCSLLGQRLPDSRDKLHAILQQSDLALSVAWLTALWLFLQPFS
eukprot:2756496-Amphidinium_carterae.1